MKLAERGSPLCSGAKLRHLRTASMLAAYRAHPSDVLLTLAVTFWLLGLPAINTGVLSAPWSIRQFGLLGGLPATYFASLAVLVASVGMLLGSSRVSPFRLMLHLVALILFLHGTPPLVYSTPRFAWTYKHIGVTQYIATHGSVNGNVDIYQSWPGFFALAAWFDRVAGVSSPLAYAAWSQLFFNLLSACELHFAFRALPMTDRERWLALFLFVGGNWVGQDYFSPQATGFVLSLAVLAIALHWLRDDHPPRWLRASGARGRERIWWNASGERNPSDVTGRPRIVALVIVFGTFAALVMTHELSPYVVIVQIGVLAATGRIRPRWTALGLLVIALAYLVPNFAVVNSTYNLVNSLTHPFQNLLHSTAGLPPGTFGRRLAGDSARVLSVTLGLLGLVGVWRGRHSGRPVAMLTLLAISPFVFMLLTNYGGEAFYRAYLFSLPWTACLGAVGVMPRSISAGRQQVLAVPIALLVVVGLILPAYFGLDEEYVTPLPEVQAVAYFYAHAVPGSVLLSSPDFPTRVSANYSEFLLGPSDVDPNFLESGRLWHRILGAPDLPAIAAMIRYYYPHGGYHPGYLVLSTGQANYAVMFGILPPGSIENLENALLHSPNWSVFYRNSDTIIFELLPSSK